MAELFIEGFDKYGPTGTLGVATAGVAATLANLLTQGEWTSTSVAANASINVGAPLSATGQSLVFTGSPSGGAQCNENPGNYVFPPDRWGAFLLRAGGYLGPYNLPGNWDC